MSVDLILEADGTKAVSEVALDARKRAKEEAIQGITINKFGRVVIINRKKYSHMRKCGDLLLDMDGNQTRFTKLSQDQIKAYKTGNMKQNQMTCSATPEDITDLEVEVKSLLKKDYEDSKGIRKDFIKHQADVKNKKDGNITVITANNPANDSKGAELESREKALEAREKAIETNETNAKTNADKEKALDLKEKDIKEKELEAREKALEVKEKALESKEDKAGGVKTNPK